MTFAVRVSMAREGIQRPEAFRYLRLNLGETKEFKRAMKKAAKELIEDAEAMEVLYQEESVDDWI